VSDLSKEMENGRLLRLMVKLGFVNERPEGDVVSWDGMEGAKGARLRLCRLICSGLPCSLLTRVQITAPRIPHPSLLTSPRPRLTHAHTDEPLV